MAAILDFFVVGFFGGGEGPEGPQQGPKGPPALRRSEKEGRTFSYSKSWLKNIVGI